MNEYIEETTCYYCGAPVRTEICPYCGKPTGLNTQTAVLEYPEIECKEAHLNFWGTIFPLIFALSFGFFGFAASPFFTYSTDEIIMVELMLLPFKVISIVATLMVIVNIWRYISIILFGKEIEGIVYGYFDDSVTYNNQPGQVCKILVTSRHGKRFIMYQLKDTKKPYKVNTSLPLSVYKNRFLILNKHKYEIWD